MKRFFKSLPENSGSSRRPERGVMNSIDPKPVRLRLDPMAYERPSTTVLRRG